MSDKCPSPTGEKKTYHVRFEIVAEITLDTSLTPDDEFRQVFYEFYTLAEMAEHIAWNRAVKKFPGHVEGLYPEQHELFTCRVIEEDILGNTVEVSEDEGNDL